MIPLTHHDVVRFSAPLVRAGLAIDPEASDRAGRRIVFRVQVSPPRGGDRDDREALHVLHSLTVLAGGEVELVRAVADARSGLVSTLIASAAAAGSLIEVFRRIEPDRQIVREGTVAIAQSWTLEPAPDRGGEDARLELQHVVGRAGSLVLIVDVSSGAGMPATALLASDADWTDHLQTLASGAPPPPRHPTAGQLLASLAPAETRRGGTTAETSVALLAALPDDALAVLGPGWRPLTWQGNRWKGVLRLLGREPERSARAGAHVREALAHLARIASEPPSRYHVRHAVARRRVFVRRLRPLMALGAILALMPLSWLLVSHGGVRMHPMALALTPLLMVGVVLASAHEIPVMEWPPWPRALHDARWTASAPDPHA